MGYYPQPGDIGLVRIGGPTGKLIRVGQWALAKVDDRDAPDDEDWADYQHAFLYLGGGKLIEAEPGGARIRDLSEYDSQQVYWCHSISAMLTAEQRRLIVSVARDFEHTPYSFLDYFVLTAHKLRIPLPGAQEFVASTRHMICSQLCARAYDMAHVPLFGGMWPGDVDPLDLFLLDKQIWHQHNDHR